MTDRIDSVIADGSLRRLAHERSATSAPVLIELATPARDAEVAVASGRRATVGVRAADGRTPPDGAVGEVSGILGRTPRYLRAARSFAAVATGAQLAALAASPTVAAIRPDRQLRLH